MLADRLRVPGKQAAGVRYELEVASHCSRSAGKVLLFVSLNIDVTAGKTDIDVACQVGGKKVLYQVKRSADAFKKAIDGTKLTDVKRWVAKAKQYAKSAGFDEVRYAVPGLDVVPTRVAEGDKLSVLQFLQRSTGGIDPIPHAPVSF